MLKISSPFPINRMAAHLCLCFAWPERHRLHWRLCQPEQPRKTPFAQGTNSRENNCRVCSDRGYCLLISASLLQGIERKRVNEAGKCRKTSRSLWSKSVQFCCQQPPFLQSFLEMPGQPPWTGLRNQAISVQYAEAGPKPLPSTHTTLT